LATSCLTFEQQIGHPFDEAQPHVGVFVGEPLGERSIEEAAGGRCGADDRFAARQAGMGHDIGAGAVDFAENVPRAFQQHGA
jgi:hypothetical protein